MNTEPCDHPVCRTCLYEYGWLHAEVIHQDPPCQEACSVCGTATMNGLFIRREQVSP